VLRAVLIFALLILWSFPALAADLPKVFQGSWKNNDGAGGDVEVTGIHVGARTYHEPGYNCTIKSIIAKNDATVLTPSKVYIVDMTCAGDGPSPGPAKKVREVWALRKINGEEVLVMAGATGATYPSIHILQRAD
jgi:hypothetical protein